MNKSGTKSNRPAADRTIAKADVILYTQTLSEDMLVICISAEQSTGCVGTQTTNIVIWHLNASRNRQHVIAIKGD